MPRKRKSDQDVKQELNMAEHTARLRALPVGPWDTLRRIIIWLAAGVLLCALGWLALGR